jgi:hypothetical protein
MSPHPSPLDAWLDAARADAERRGLAPLTSMLDALGRMTAALRAADWNLELSGTARPGRPTAPVEPNER